MSFDIRDLSRLRATEAIEALKGDPEAFALLLREFEIVIGPEGFAACARFDNDCKRELHPGTVEVLALPWAWWDSPEKKGLEG